MLTNLFAALEPLGLTQAIRLVTGSVAVGLVLIVLPGDALTGAVFLLQRAMILVLLWPRVPTQLLASSAVASLAVGLIYSATVLSLLLRGRVNLRPQPSLLGHLPFRVVAAALSLLLASAAVHGFTMTALPELMLWMVAWLLVQSVFALLLATSPLQTGIGVLAFADAGRIVYSLLQPDPLLWGVWAACDVLIALGVASLRSHNTQDAPAASTPPVPEVQQSVPSDQRDLPTAGQSQ